MTEKLDLKVILLGSSGAGKTSLLTRYMQGNFTDNPSTIGASFQLKTWKNYKLGLWDTAGQERYASLSSYYCRGVGAAILVYDVSDSTSFEALDTYLKLLRAVQPDCYCILVGTKCDMLLPDEQVQLDTLMRASQQCLFLYTTPSMGALGSSAALLDINATDSPGIDSGAGTSEALDEWDMIHDAAEVTAHARAESKNSSQSKPRDRGQSQESLARVTSNGPDMAGDKNSSQSKKSKEKAEDSAGEIEDLSERVMGHQPRRALNKKKHRSRDKNTVIIDGGEKDDSGSPVRNTADTGDRQSSGCEDTRHGPTDHSLPRTNASNHMATDINSTGTGDRNSPGTSISSTDQSEASIKETSISSTDQSDASFKGGVRRRRNSGEHRTEHSNGEDNTAGRIEPESTCAKSASRADTSHSNSDRDRESRTSDSDHSSNTDSDSGSGSESDPVSSEAESMTSDEECADNAGSEGDNEHVPVRVWHGPLLDSGPIFAEREGMDFVYVSAKTGLNVVNIFDRIGYKCLETKRVQHEMLASPLGNEVSTVNLNSLINNQPVKKGKCC